eukprot:2513285-Amphidinium_carterae.4
MQFLRNQAEEVPESDAPPGRGSQKYPCITFGEDRLRVVPSYHYLGRWTAAKPGLQQEYDVRKARTIQSFTEHERVYKSRQLSVGTRMTFFRSLTRGHLTQNCVTYGQCNSKQWAALSGTHMLLVRKTVHLHDPELLRRVTDEQLLRHIGEPSLRQQFDMHISVHAAKACTSNNPQLQAALSYRGEGSVWDSWMPVLDRLWNASANLNHLPAPTVDSIDAWVQHMENDLHAWKVCAKAAFMDPCKPQTDLTKIYSVLVGDIVETFSGDGQVDDIVE